MTESTAGTAVLDLERFRSTALQNPRVAEELARSSKVSDFRGAFDIFFSWAVILCVAWTAEHSSNLLMTIFAVLVIGSRQHALLSLMHESAHGHLFSNRKVNEFCSDLFCSFPLFFISRYYRQNHIAHHLNLNGPRDPDWVRKPNWSFPKSPLGYLRFLILNGTFVSHRRIILFLRTMSSPKVHTRYFYLYLMSLAATLLVLVVLFLPTRILVYYWLAPAFIALPTLGLIRSVAEHFGLNYERPLHSTRDIKCNWVERSLFGPESICFHLTHHLFPEIPRYRLESMHNCLVKNTEFKSLAKINDSYILPTKHSLNGDVMKANLSRGKSGACHDE